MLFLMITEDVYLKRSVKSWSYNRTSEKQQHWNIQCTARIIVPSLLKSWNL